MVWYTQKTIRQKGESNMENLVETEKKIVNQYYNKKSERPVKMECIDCGGEFETTVGRICTTHTNGLVVPCRCQECKQAKDEKFKAYGGEESDK